MGYVVEDLTIAVTALSHENAEDVKILGLEGCPSLGESTWPHSAVREDLNVVVVSRLSNSVAKNELTTEPT